MTFKVTLKNQHTGTERDVEVKSIYDATSVVSHEAKTQMNIPSEWDLVKVVRIDVLCDLFMSDMHPEFPEDREWERGLTRVEMLDRVVKQLESETDGDYMRIEVRTYIPN